MPGAPNRPPPPEKTAAAPPPPIPEPPEKKALRRLVPTRVALLLDTWKGAPSPELTGPFRKAEETYARGDYAATLPEPFRLLRVPIPTPVPPHWDPDHALAPPEKEAKKALKTAEEQLTLAKGCLEWASGHGINTEDLAPRLGGAAARLADPAGLAPFYEEIDAFWSGLHGRLPSPKFGAAPAAPAPAEPEEA